MRSAKTIHNTHRLKSLQNIMGPTWDKINLEKKLEEELRKSYFETGKFDDGLITKYNSEEVINDKITPRKYQALKEKILEKEKKKQTSASLNDKKYTIQDIDGIIKRLRDNNERTKNKLDNKTWSEMFDNYSTNNAKRRATKNNEENIKNLINLKKYIGNNKEPVTIKQIIERIPEIPKYKYIYDTKDAENNNSRHKELKRLVKTLNNLKYIYTGGTRTSKRRTSKTRTSKTRKTSKKFSKK